MQDLARLNDWRARLAAEMDRQRRTPFQWGRQDCAIGFAASIVEALTGADLARGYRGKYASPRGALKVMHEAGADSLGDFAAQVLPERENLLIAQVGDIGVIDADGPVGEAFCMVDVSSLIVMTGTGHGHRPRSHMKRAFKVG